MMGWFAAVEFGDSIEARLVALAGAVAGVVMIFRLIMRYERVFIADQDREILELRGEIKAFRVELDAARQATRTCHDERVQDRTELGLLRLEVTRLREQLEA